MDKMNPDDAKEAIFWEAEQHVPFDIDDVCLDFQVLNDTGLGQVVCREEQSAASCGTGSEGDGEGTPDGAQVPLQAYFSQDHGILKVSLGKLAAGHQQAQRDRQIQRGTILAYIRGSQVHSDAPQGELEAGIGEGGGDSLPALLDGPVRQTDG